MKNTIIALAGSVLVASALVGCKQLDWAGGKIYKPTTVTNIVSTPTGDYPVVVTNGWTLKPSVRTGIEVAGDIAPFPWAGLASNAIIAALGIGAHIRGRKWSKAAASGVSAAQAFKKELSQIDQAKAKSVKNELILKQTADGTRRMVQMLLSKL